jgi:hypothetical protein
MNAQDAIHQALSPGTMLNQRNKVWRSVSALGQFADLDNLEVLETLNAHFADVVTIRPNVAHPDNGPLVALIEHIPPGEVPEEAVDPEAPVQVHALGGNAVAAPEAVVPAAEVGNVVAEGPVPIGPGQAVAGFFEGPAPQVGAIAVAAPANLADNFGMAGPGGFFGADGVEAEDALDIDDIGEVELVEEEEPH